MDPLSLSCNIVGVLTVASKLLSLGYSYGNSVKDFPEDIRDLVGELSSLSGILHALKATMDPPDDGEFVFTKADPSDVARAITIPLEDCERLLLDMVGDLERYQKVGSKVQKAVKRLYWPLKETETKIWVERIGRYKSTFSLALSADVVSLTRAIRENLERISIDQQKEREENILIMQREKTMKILQWLSSVDPEPNHRAAQNLRQVGTGGWLTGGKAYRDWFNAKGSFLWLYGLPGSGKTILSSHIIDHILAGARASSSSDVAIAYFYCDFQEKMKQTTAGLLGSIIAQLLSQQQKMKIPKEVQGLYQRKNSQLDSSSIESLQKALPSITRQFSKIIVVIDALDECANRGDFLQSIKWFRNLEKVNLLVTSRDELDIKLEFEGLPSLMISSNNIANDIELYVINEIERQPKLRRLKETIKSEIICSLVRQADGMFRWVSCCLDQIGTLRNDRAIKAALVSLPRTLEGTYERILCQIPAEDKEMAKGVLRWLVYNWCPMTIDQILEGIAVEIGETAIDPENRGNFPEDILDICRGLTAMDDESRKLRLAHFTVKEYLISAGISQGPVADYHMPPGTSNAELAKVCLTYLMFDDFGVGACSTIEELEYRRKQHLLYGYAAGSLYTHVSDYTKNGVDEALDQLLLRFFLLDGNSGNFAAWSQANMGFKQYLDTNPKRTPLFCAAILGLDQVVIQLLKTGEDVNGYCDGDLGDMANFRTAGGRPLIGAIIGDHYGMVRLLLENGANPNLLPNPNQPSSTTGTPISVAGSSGRAKCLQVLLDHGAEENNNLEYGAFGRVIQSAAWNGHQEAVEVLIKTKRFRTAVADVDDEVTRHLALYLSAESGFENTVCMLLEMRGDMAISPECEFFPMILRVSVDRRRFKITRALLQKPDIKAFCMRDDFFPGLLECAAFGGHEKIIELLLNARENLSARDLGISLHTAAARGHAEALERLLRAGANPWDKDPDGWTPVICASQYKQEHCMEMLMKGVEDWDIIDNKPIFWGKEGAPLTAEIYNDGLEIKNDLEASRHPVTFRAQHPATPLCEKFYFEVQVINCSPDQIIGIGFGDKLELSSWTPPDIWGTQPGHVRGSWGYQNSGSLTSYDTMDPFRGLPFGTGAIVGCCLDSKSRTAQFTVNGSKTNLPFADVKGKLFPIITLGSGTHIRTNFGGEPFVYGVPSLSAEEIQNAHKLYLMEGLHY